MHSDKCTYLLKCINIHLMNKRLIHGLKNNNIYKYIYIIFKYLNIVILQNTNKTTPTFKKCWLSFLAFGKQMRLLKTGFVVVNMRKQSSYKYCPHNEYKNVFFFFRYLNQFETYFRC